MGKCDVKGCKRTAVSHSMIAGDLCAKHADQYIGLAEFKHTTAKRFGISNLNPAALMR